VGFVLMLISFAAAGIYVYQYVTGSFRLLELMRQSAPATWDALGRPEKVYVRSGEGGMG